MRTRLGAGAVALGAAAVLVGSGLAVAAPASATTSANRIAFLLTNDGTGLASYRIDSGVLAPTASITGLAGDTALVGIDVRVQNRRIYGVGNEGGVYVVSAQGVAQKVLQLSIDLVGGSYGVDFNPAANALRIVSDGGQNLRQSLVAPYPATTLDFPLNYTAGVTATGIGAAAYTNNDLSADSGTTLFVLDANLNQVATQAPANNGSLQLTGKLGVDVPADIGFDIYSTLDGAGRTTDNTAFAVVPGDGSTTLHQVSLLTGQASAPLRTVPVVATDIAVLLQAPAA